MNFVIDPMESHPIYQQIEAQIIKGIFSGELAPNQKVPPVRELASHLKVALLTVKIAYDHLIDKGFLYTMQTKGTFVAPLTKKEMEKKKEALVFDTLLPELDYLKKSGIDLKFEYTIK